MFVTVFALFNRAKFGWWIPALLTVAAVAQTNAHIYRQGNDWVEETSGFITGARLLHVRTMVGNVAVTGGDSRNVHYTVKKRVSGGSEEAARRAFDTFRINSGLRSASTAYIGCAWSSGGWHKGNADIVIDVPRNIAGVKINTQVGNVNLTHINGYVDSQTGGGYVFIDDIGGRVSSGSGGGQVKIGKVASDLIVRTGGNNIAIDSVGRNLRASSGGGAVRIVSTKGSVQVDTGGGDIEVKQAGGGLHAQTGGGNIDIGDVSGPVVLETSGGSIRLISGTGKVTARTSEGAISCGKVSAGLVAQTGAGGITAEFIGTKKDFSDSHLETGTGDIVVYLPSDLAVDVRAAIEFANGHSILSDFQEIKIRSEGGNYGPKEVYGEGALNGGGPVLKLHTTTGNIELRRIKRYAVDETARQ